MIALVRRALLPILVSALAASFFATCSSSGGGGGTGGAGGNQAGSGGAGAGNDPVALCKQVCDTSVSLCLADAGATAEAAARTLCEGSCPTQNPTGTMACLNESGRITAYKACATKTTCSDITTCTQNVLPCIRDGLGGSSGSGGSTGGGVGGAAGGTGCADLLACCNATTSASGKQVCMTYYGTVASMGDAACSQALTLVKSMYCP
jgi:hypothetical protein